MGKEKLFSDEELQTMGKRTLDLLLEKLDSGDVKAAKALAQQMYNEFLGMHDLYRDWITHVFSFIGERMGDDTFGRLWEKLWPVIRSAWANAMPARINGARFKCCWPVSGGICNPLKCKKMLRNSP